VGDERYRVEPFDLWHYFSRSLFEPAVRLRVDLADRLDADLLARAVVASCTTLPLIGCGFLGTGRRPRWVPRPGAAREVVRVVTADGDHEGRVQQALAAGIDLERGPQLTLTLVRQRDSDTLCAVVNHMLCDATGFTEYLGELSRLYTTLAAGGEPVPAPWRTRGSRAAMRGIGPARRARILRSRFDAYDQSTAGAAGRPEFRHADGPVRLLTRPIAADDFAAARSVAKARGASANDLFMAAFAHAWAVRTGRERVALPSTIDVRQFVVPGTRLGITNLSSNALCSIQLGPGVGLDGALQQVTQQMAVHKSGTAALKSVLMWNLAVGALPYRFLASRFMRLVTFPAVSFTNLGVLADETVTFGTVPVESAHFSTAIKPSPFFQLTVSTFRGVPTLSTNIVGDDEAASFAAGVLDATAQGVDALAGG